MGPYNPTFDIDLTASPSTCPAKSAVEEWNYAVPMRVWTLQVGTGSVYMQANEPYSFTKGDFARFMQGFYIGDLDADQTFTVTVSGTPKGESPITRTIKFHVNFDADDVWNSTITVLSVTEG